MKLPIDPQLPIVWNKGDYVRNSNPAETTGTTKAQEMVLRYLDDFNWKITQLLRDTARQVNGLSAGHVNVVDSYTAAPTTGTWNNGDYVRNSNPAEAGSASSKYVVTGWICTVAGTPGTWLACRSLTGN